MTILGDFKVIFKFGRYCCSKTIILLILLNVIFILFMIGLLFVYIACCLQDKVYDVILSSFSRFDI